MTDPADTDTRMDSLTSIRPTTTPQRLLADLVPPRHFAGARFENYRANPAFPSQGATVARLHAAADTITTPPRRSWLARKAPVAAPAVYLDGGFGVG
jgi:cell division protein ZapE